VSTLTERHAAGILEAWRRSDRERVNATLAGAAAIELSGDAHACEQADLLRSIAAEMQNMLASGRTEVSHVCLNLLRHLACPRRMGFYMD
jgi:hypothetical protein